MPKYINFPSFGNPGQSPEVVNRETQDNAPPSFSADDFGHGQFPPPRIGNRGVPLAWEFVCFLEMAKLGGPGRRQKPANEGGEGRDPVIGGIVSVQRFLNLSNWLSLVTGPSAF